MANFWIFPSFDQISATGGLAEGINPGVWEAGGLGSGSAVTLIVPFSEGVLYLDGDTTPLALADLPTGFTITSALLRMAVSGTSVGVFPNPGATLTLDQCEFGSTTPTSHTTIDGHTKHDFTIAGPFSEVGFIGLNQVTARLVAGSPGTNWYLNFVTGYPAKISDMMNVALESRAFYITGEYTITDFHWALFFEDEEIAGVEFRRVRVEEFAPISGPPEGADLVTDVEPVPVWWEFELPTGGFIYVYQALTPGDGWVEVAAPENYGWWDSMQDAFFGNAAVVVDATPKRPRGFEQIAAFATGTASPFGGHPGPGVVLRQKLVYAGGSYTVGTNYPPIRIFDGLSDRELVRLPPTLSGAIPKAVMSMMTVNGIIYLTTFDSGTTSADFAGRVFSLDIASAKLELIGATFSSGEIPYCLAWHNGRLWCGTNQQDPTASGAIYWFRPGVDSVWTQDKVLSTEGQGGALSMQSFGGKLYVGCSAAAGTAAEILARSPDGSWAVAFTGPETDANNGFIACTVWPIVQPSLYSEPQLFFSYWSQDTASGPDTSLIKKFDGSSWTTSYTGTGETVIPFIALANINTVLYAVGGGYDLPVQLIVSYDGENWDVVTEFLPDNDDETATNIIVDMRQ